MYDSKEAAKLLTPLLRCFDYRMKVPQLRRLQWRSHTNSATHSVWIMTPLVSYAAARTIPALWFHMHRKCLGVFPILSILVSCHFSSSAPAVLPGIVLKDFIESNIFPLAPPWHCFSVNFCEASRYQLDWPTVCSVFVDQISSISPTGLIARKNTSTRP